MPRIRTLQGWRRGVQSQQLGKVDEPPPQNIYAYCHVRTNQVLYSLTRKLDAQRALQQLPDAGANNKPSSLRKDLWKPFFTVCLPATAGGQAQCLNTFDYLQQWRHLHETNWTPPTLLKRQYTKEEIEKLQEKYDNRGGSKAESVYDIIKREKKKMRARIVMDQKANSIADLAAILQKQDELSSKRVEAMRHHRESENREMLLLAEQGLSKLWEEETRVKRHRNLLAEARRFNRSPVQRLKLRKELIKAEWSLKRLSFATVEVAKVSPRHRDTLYYALSEEERSTERLRQGKALRKLGEFESTAFIALEASESQLAWLNEKGLLVKRSARRRELEAEKRLATSNLTAVRTAVKIVRRAEFWRDDPDNLSKVQSLKKRPRMMIKEALRWNDSLEEAEDLSEVFNAMQPTESASGTENLTDKKPWVPATSNVTRTIEYEPRKRKEVEQEAPKLGPYLPPFPAEFMARAAPKFDIQGQKERERFLQAYLKKKSRPVYSSEGVTIKWDNSLDAEFAQTWPANVKHEPMGRTLHTAPKPEERPIMTEAELRERQRENRKSGYTSGKLIWALRNELLGETRGDKAKTAKTASLKVDSPARAIV